MKRVRLFFTVYVEQFVDVPDDEFGALDDGDMECWFEIDDASIKNYELDEFEVEEHE